MPTLQSGPSQMPQRCLEQCWGCCRTALPLTCQPGLPRWLCYALSLSHHCRVLCLHGMKVHHASVKACWSVQLGYDMSTHYGTCMWFAKQLLDHNVHSYVWRVYKQGNRLSHQDQVRSHSKQGQVWFLCYALTLDSKMSVLQKHSPNSRCP